MKKILSLSLFLLLLLSLCACNQTTPAGSAADNTQAEQSSTPAETPAEAPAETPSEAPAEPTTEPTTGPTTNIPSESPAETAAAAPLSEEQELKLYAEYAAANPDEAAQFALYDWDGDGVRELYMISPAVSGHRGRMGIFTIRDGEVVPVYQSGDHGLVELVFEIVSFRGERFLCEYTYTASASSDPIHGTMLLMDRDWQTVHTIETVTLQVEEQGDTPHISSVSDLSSISVDKGEASEGYVVDLFEEQQPLLSLFDGPSDQMSYAELVAFAGAAN